MNSSCMCMHGVIRTFYVNFHMHLHNFAESLIASTYMYIDMRRESLNYHNGKTLYPGDQHTCMCTFCLV